MKKSSVSSRGQTVIPAAIRRQYGLEPGTELLWAEEEGSLRVYPIHTDAISALRGAGRGERLVERLLEDRREERDRERR